MSRRIAVLLGVLCALTLLLPRRAAAQEAVEYYATDALGSVRVVFASNGNVKGRMDFGPYGEQLTTAEGIGQKVFAQITFDGESAMDYAEARMFQLRTGRFNAPDSVYAGLHDPQRWNRYNYARNNPLLFVDPTGLQESAGPVPSLCTAAIRELNPNDFHCQPTNVGNGGGGNQGSWLTWAMDFFFAAEPLWSAESDWTESTPSGAYVPSTAVQVAVVAGAAVVSIPAARKAIGAVVDKVVGKAVGEAAGQASSRLYHYTPGDTAKIAAEGIELGKSGQIFTTPNGNLTPIQAQIELALPPNRGLPGGLLEIDMEILGQHGITPITGPVRVIGTPTAPGGGIEVIFNQPIPPNALRVIR